MNIEKQYIELYDQYHSLIDSHASPILNALREKAMSDFRVTGFPSPNDEEYKHTNIPDLFAPDYGLNLNRLEIPVNPYEVFRCDVPNLSTLLYFVVNDSFYTKENPKVKLPEGVLIGSLNEMARSHPDLVRETGLYPKRWNRRIKYGIRTRRIFSLRTERRYYRKADTTDQYTTGRRRFYG